MKWVVNIHRFQVSIPSQSDTFIPIIVVIYEMCWVQNDCLLAINIFWDVSRFPLSACSGAQSKNTKEKCEVLCWSLFSSIIPLEYLFQFGKKPFIKIEFGPISDFISCECSTKQFLIKTADLTVIVTEGTFVTVSVHSRILDLDVKCWETQTVCSWNIFYSYRIFIMSIQQ